MFLATSLILLIFWGVYYHFKNFRLYKISWNVPGPLNFPFIGLGYWLTGSSVEITTKLMHMFDAYPGISKGWIMNDLFYFVTKPEYLQIILNSSKALAKPQIYDYIKPLFGEGLLTSKVNVWKNHRKTITPSFNQKMLKQYPKIISDQCTVLLDILNNFVGTDINHCHYITNCTIDIVGEAFFDQTLKTQFSTIPYSNALYEFFETSYIRGANKLYHYDFVFNTSKYYKTYVENIQLTKQLVKTVIDEKLQKSRDSLEEESDKYKSFLSNVVEKYRQNEWTIQELEDEVSTLIIGGADTVASAVSFVLIMLAMHPDVEQKVYDEVIGILGPSKLIESEDLPNFAYTERVIKETLRLFPGAPFSQRVAQDDIDLGKYIIPKNANIFIGYINLHRNKKYWPDPLVFDPNRFLPENSLHRHPYSWIPFSAGPRNCIGFKFGMMNAKIIVALIIRKFKVSTTLKKVEDVEYSTSVVMKPKEGIKLRFHLR